MSNQGDQFEQHMLAAYRESQERWRAWDTARDAEQLRYEHAVQTLQLHLQEQSQRMASLMFLALNPRITEEEFSRLSALIMSSQPPLTAG